MIATAGAHPTGDDDVTPQAPGPDFLAHMLRHAEEQLAGVVQRPTFVKTAQQPQVLAHLAGSLEVRAARPCSIGSRGPPLTMPWRTALPLRTDAPRHRASNRLDQRVPDLRRVFAALWDAGGTRAAVPHAPGAGQPRAQPVWDHRRVPGPLVHKGLCTAHAR